MPAPKNSSKGKRFTKLAPHQQREDPFRAKKHLGQHFLTDMSIAQDVSESLTGHGGYKQLLEIGPGTGVLTQFLGPWHEPPAKHLWLVDVDAESVAYMHKHYPQLAATTLHEDFLKWDLSAKFDGPVGIIGNFPYNISSMIFFKVLDFVDQVPEVVCMLQKEVAERLASPPGNKDYGILSVLLQVWYDIDYCFTVPEHVFSPPPKVKSGVIRLRRNTRTSLPCPAHLFKMVVKQGFNNRRKTLRNALRGLNLASLKMEGLHQPAEDHVPMDVIIDPITTPQNDSTAPFTDPLEHPAVLPYMDKRAEQLGVEDFITLTLGLMEATRR